MLTENSIFREVRKIFDEFKITDSPVDVDKILATKGFIISERELPDNFASVLDMSKDSPVLLIEKKLGSEEKRFVKAHALGHFLLERKDFEGIFTDKQRTLKSQILVSEKSEICADQFAAALLAPKEILLKKLDEAEKTKKNDSEILVSVAKALAVTLGVVILAIALFSDNNEK